MTKYSAFASRLALGLTLCSTSLLVGACAVGNDSAEQSESLGRLNMALTSTTASGNTYRLRDAEFELEASGFSQGTLSSETNPDAPTLTADLQVGDYTIELGPFWSMEKQVSPGVYEEVPAELLSSRVQTFAITEGASTAVVYEFKVAGDLAVFGGSLVVSTTVVEESCQDDLAEPNDDKESARPITAGQSYDLAICMGDADFFVLDVEHGRRLTVDLAFVNAEGDIDVQIKNEAGSTLGNGTSINDGEHVVIDPFVGQQAFIRVTGFRNASNTYTLSTLLEESSVTPPPAGWLCNASYYGTNDGCDCGCGVVDSDCASQTATCAFDSCPAPTTANPLNNAQCL